MNKIGKYSGNERLDPKLFEEPDLENDFTREMWFNEVINDPDFLKDVQDSVKKWKQNIAITADPEKIELHMVGQSHIDVAWRWRYEQTRKKAIITFKKAVYHAKKFAGTKYKYNFALSEPLLLDWVLQDDPKLFKEIQETVKNGGIELIGGAYVEPDCMMPSGEAMVRSRLYGQRFLRDHFGTLAKNEWFLDSFGYNYGLPQILAKSGAESFYTSKITWNRQTIFPFVNFWWEGPDGTRLLTSNFKMGTGTIDDWMMFEMGRHLLKNEGQKVWNYSYDYGTLDEHVEENEICPHVGVFFGKGDGGHGPTHQEVVTANAWQDTGFMKWSTVEGFFKKLKEYSDRFPVWNDELYLEYHRGTFTVHSEVKRHNRYYENAIIDLETLALITSISNPKYQYPADKFERLWKILLQNQFHDVLPGSSIPEVYDDIYDFWVEQDEIIEDIKHGISAALNESHKTVKKDTENEKTISISLYNPVSWTRKSPVFIPIGAFGTELKMEKDGKPPYAKLTIGSNVYIAQPVAADALDSPYPRPAGWYTLPELKGLTLTPATLTISSLEHLNLKSSEFIEATPDFISNNISKIKLDKNTGAFLELISKNINKEENLLRGSSSNLFFGFLDDFPNDHAWNIKPKYWEYPLSDIKNDEEVNLNVIDQGPVFSTIEINRVLGKDKSPVTQKVTLFKDCPEVYLEWSTNWKQPFVFLKILYSTATNATITTSDQMYSAIQRATQGKSPCDWARYEKIMHKYADVSTPENTWGIALINEGKYAYDTMGELGDIRLSLLRTPRYPTPAGEAWVIPERRVNKEKYGHDVPEFSGLGPEKCRYIILPHNGGALMNSDGSANAIVKQKAEEFNQPVVVIESVHNTLRTDLIKEILEVPIIEISPSNVFLGALKFNEWEKSGTIVMRIVEGCGIASTKVEIKLNPKLNSLIKSIRPIDLLERPITNKKFNWDKNNRIITLELSKFEICSFEIIL